MKKKDVENNNLSNVYDLTCPQCGTAMDYNRGAHTVTCSYCGHKYRNRLLLAVFLL